MKQTGDHSLNDGQTAELSRFFELQHTWKHDRDTVRTAAALSTPALEAVWSNHEDEVYDSL
jgi:hypothetical protein